MVSLECRTNSFYGHPMMIPGTFCGATIHVIMTPLLVVSLQALSWHGTRRPWRCPRLVIFGVQNLDPTNRMLVEKTGTTIVGVRYKTGVVLCADTRSTSGPVVANKNCKKIHFISEKIMCCGAGTAADTERVTRMASRDLQLFKYKHMKDPYVTHAERLITEYLHGYGGQIGAALVLGGCDDNGIFLYSISPHGYSNAPEFTSLGSGSYAAIAVLEDGFKKDMTKDEASELGTRAVKAGILNDLFSGSQVDRCVIDIIEGVEYTRSFLVVESKRNATEIVYPPGSVDILEEEIYNYIDGVYE